MSTIKITVNGIDIEVSSTEEAAALIKQLNGQQSSHKPQRSTSVPTPFNSASRLTPDALQITKKFLIALREGSASGVDGETMAKALGTARPKGIGGKMMPINKVLKELGFKSNQIFDNPRGIGGKRIWTKGRLVDEAIQKVEAQLSSK